MKLSSDNPNEVTLELVGANGQVADHFKVKNYAGTTLFSVDADGDVGFVFPGEPAVSYIEPTYVVSVADGTYTATACLTGGTNYSGTNFVTVINQVFNAVTDGGIIFIKNGTYVCDDADPVLESKNYVRIIGESWGTIFYRADDQDPPAIPTTGCFLSNLLRLSLCNYCTVENIQFSGNFTKQVHCNDGSHPSSYDNIQLTEGRMGMEYAWQNASSSENCYNGILLDGSEYCTIRNCWAHDNGTNNIHIGTCRSTRDTGYHTSDHNSVFDCLIEEGRNGILTYGDYIPGYSDPVHGDYTIISGCHFYNGRGYAGIYIYGDFNTITNCISNGYVGTGAKEGGSWVGGSVVDGQWSGGTYSGGTNLWADGCRTVHCDHTTISNCVMNDNQVTGFHTATDCTTTTVTGNTFDNNGWSSIIYAGDAGLIVGNICTDTLATNNISIATSTNVVIEGNYISGTVSDHNISVNDSTNIIITGNIIKEAGECGVVILDSSHCEVRGNTIFDNGQSGTGFTYGILLEETDTSCSNCIVEGNYVYDTETGASRTQTYGIRVLSTTAFTSVIVRNNVFNNNKTANVLRDAHSLAESTEVWFSNIGYLTENTVLSSTFAIDSTGVKTVTFTHGLGTTPAIQDCRLTVVEDTAVDDWAFDLLKVTAVSSTQVTAKINVSTASATGSSTAKLSLRVGK